MALANRYTGKDLYAEFINSSGVIPLTADQTAFVVSKEIEMRDVTPGDTAEKEYAVSIKEGSIEVTLLDVGSVAATAIDTILDVGVTGTLIYAPKGTATLYTLPKRGFPVIVEGKSFSYPYDDVVEVEIQFKKIGSAIFGGTATWNYSDEAYLYMHDNTNLNNSAVRAAAGTAMTRPVEVGVIFPSKPTPKVGSGGVTQFAENTKNLCYDPQFGASDFTAAWGSLHSAGGSVTGERSTDFAFIGTHSFKMQADSDYVYIDSEAAWRPSLPDGSTISISGWYYSAGAREANTYIEIYDTTNGASRATSQPTGGVGWEYLNCSWTNDTGLAATINIILASREKAQFSYFDAIQVELLTYSTPYCDGTLGTGHEWLGTAHASASQRRESLVQIPNSSIFRSAPTAVSFSWWAALVDVDAAGPTYPYWFHMGNSASDRVFCTMDPTNQFSEGSAHVVIGFYKAVETPTTYVADLGTMTGDSTFDHFAAVLTALDTSAPVITTYRNGTAIGGATATWGIASLAAGTFSPGSYVTAGFEMNGWQNEFLVFDRALSATEVTAIYNRGAAGNTA